MISQTVCWIAYILLFLTTTSLGLFLNGCRNIGRVMFISFIVSSVLIIPLIFYGIGVHVDNIKSNLDTYAPYSCAGIENIVNLREDTSISVKENLKKISNIRLKDDFIVGDITDDKFILNNYSGSLTIIDYNYKDTTTKHLYKRGQKVHIDCLVIVANTTVGLAGDSLELNVRIKTIQEIAN